MFALTPLGRTLASGQPGSMRDVIIMFMEARYAPFGELLPTIRTGQPAAEPMYGEPFFAWLPHVITFAPQNLASHGVGDRAECVGGDFFESVPPAAMPTSCRSVLHDWPGAKVQCILANIAAAGRGARLLVLDFIVPPGDAPHMSKISDLNMLAKRGGKERTEPEWRELLEGAGFTGTEIRQTGTPFSIIQATAWRWSVTH